MTNEELCALAKNGDTDALDQLVSQNMRFLHKIAREVFNQKRELNRCLGLEEDDLAQEGSIALCRCIKKFDPTREIKFLSYANSAIRNAMYSYIQDQEQMLHPKDDDATPSISFITQNMEYLLDFQEGFQKLSAREQAYLSYRLGLDQGVRKRSLRETAYHFYLTESWARTTEKNAFKHLDELMSPGKRRRCSNK